MQDTFLLAAFRFTTRNRRCCRVVRIS